MDAPSAFHMREYYVLKSRRHDTDTPTYMKALSVEHANEYYKAMDDKIWSLMRRYIWYIDPRTSVTDPNVISGTWYFKCNRKLYWNISKSKAHYCGK